jgi:hypothetical protein
MFYGLYSQNIGYIINNKQQTNKNGKTTIKH